MRAAKAKQWLSWLETIVLQSGRNKLTALRDKLRTEKELVIVFGSELRGKGIAALVRCCAAIPDGKLVSLTTMGN